ncbi:MAG: hypothetical protein ACYTHK_09800 [Planctomycetota bacterium]|jgi:hypothetical protein
MKTLGCLLLTAALCAADIVVLSDRTILEGEAKGDAKSVTIAGRTVDLGEVLLWEGADGKPRNDPTLRNQLRAYDAINDRAMVKRCRELLPRAIKAKAGDSARTLLSEAERCGMEPAEVDSFAAKVKDLPDEKKDEFELGARKAFAVLLAGKAKANEAEKEASRGLELLRAALVRDEKCESALEILDEVGPKVRRGRRRPRKRDILRARPRKRVWLDWKVDVLPSKFGRIRMLDNSHVEVERARELWRYRDDQGQWKYARIYGVETDEIVFLTPMARTDIVKSCVSLARFTARALEEMFRVDDPKRGTSDPLVIYFYENQKQYIEFSGRGRGVAPNPTIAMSAGHYVPTENVSRFFWPSHAGAWESVKETFIHELTHHWIQERNPRWSRAEQAHGEDSVTTPGVWIVEGMAVFMQEARFDLERGKWDLFNPKMMSLDTVDSVGRAGELIDWKKQLTITKVELHQPNKISVQGRKGTYKGRWNLFPIPMNEMILFYKQAGATCSFLYFGEGGKYREKLLDYVTNYYTGQKEKTAIKAAFGMTEEELGKKIEAYAKKVVGGWRP